jgi:chorismate-pyruvate lyase
VRTSLSFFSYLFIYFVELCDLAESNTRPKANDIRKWLRSVDSLTNILHHYGDDDTLQALWDQRKTLGDVLGALGLDEKGRDKMRAWDF